MLCRVADSLFWMSRYIERAESTVRLLDVTLQSLLETEHSTEDIHYSHWRPLLASLGDQELFETLYEEKNSHTVTDFLTFNRENPSSVLSCVAAARENARMIRDQISSEMWEVINRLYLYLKKSDPKRIIQEMNFQFFYQIKEFSLLFQGITESTIPQRLGYEFMICGRQIERAEKTCRILDTKHFMWSMEDEIEDALDTAQWAAILRGCSAYEAYQGIYTGEIEGESVKELLMLSRDFPRSVLFSVNRLQAALHAISQCPTTHFVNEAERKTGMLISRLKYSSPADLAQNKVHELLEFVETELGDIAVEISRNYMFAEIVDPAAEVAETAS
jgi:uncharacterized alpha-E superfamily protein